FLKQPFISRWYSRYLLINSLKRAKSKGLVWLGLRLWLACLANWLILLLTLPCSAANSLIPSRNSLRLTISGPLSSKRNFRIRSLLVSPYFSLRRSSSLISGSASLKQMIRSLLSPLLLLASILLGFGLFYSRVSMAQRREGKNGM